ncbi:MAG: sodium-independent anion transporter [unclassified Hahellaceae]|nr:sodium-independent anion transporter [Hahellaceae bacterium]|tara:strand:- start:43549 stop:45294 length:1746 start_codon:yes stop_codon:yes gene_type:complete
MSARHLLTVVPAIGWLKAYRRDQLPSDLTAGFITAVLLIPQGMAYALLAGLPPEVGLYASILPPLVYALFGTSRTLSVGPVSVAALLVANALAASGAVQGEPSYLQDALLLAAMSGLILILMALLRLDVLVNFLGHSVLSGFTSGAAVLIILSQVMNLTGIPAPQGGSGVDMFWAAIQRIDEIHLVTLSLAAGSIILLLASRSPFIRLLEGIGVSTGSATLISRGGPLVIIALLTVLVATFGLGDAGVAIVGAIPSGFPSPTWDFLQAERAMALLPSAITISLIGYVESVSVAKVLAYRRREKIDNRQELIALGAANLVAGFSGSMPVAGGFSRSMVNFSAGAVTQLATIITAILVGVTTAFFTQWFFFLPKAALAAIIVVAVAPLLDWRSAVKAFRYDRADGAAMLATFLGVILFDIETGLIAGVAVAVGSFLWRSSRPHTAIVGRLPGTEHFRNIDRHEVQTWPQLLLIRIDRSLYFANVAHVEQVVAARVAQQRDISHLVIICSGVNEIDHSAIEALEQLAESLRDAGITLHLSDVKGPIMDRLARTDFMDCIAPGQIFISAEAAVEVLVRDGGSDQV